MTNDRRPRPPSVELRPESLWRTPAIVWAALILLIGVNVGVAFLHLGRATAFLNFGITGAQALLIGLVFMRLDRSSPLVRLTALAAAVFLFFLFVMSGADFFMRR